MCARACQGMSTLVSLSELPWLWARGREQVCLSAPVRRALGTLLALLKRVVRQHGTQRPSSLLWPRTYLGLSGVGKWGLASQLPRVSWAKQGRGYLLSWARAGRLRKRFWVATPIPRSFSSNVPRKPLHPSSHPLLSICLDWEALTDSYPLWAGSQSSPPALPGR